MKQAKRNRIIFEKMFLMMMFTGAAFAAESSYAALRTFEFTGFITSVYDPYNDLGGAVQVNDPFVVSHTFEETAPDLLPDKLNEGRYEGPAASLVLPGISYHTTSGLDVHVDPYFPSLSFWTPYGDQPRIFAGFDVPLSGDQLPIGWTGSPGNLIVKLDPGVGMLYGTIVPEPTVLVLMLVGLLSMEQPRQRVTYSTK